MIAGGAAICGLATMLSGRTVRYLRQTLECLRQDRPNSRMCSQHRAVMARADEVDIVRGHLLECRALDASGAPWLKWPALGGE